MATDTLAVATSTDSAGNAYTTSIVNDKMTSSEFMELLLTQIKMQDPTNPMDSEQMMQTQMQLSTIEANTTMSEAMSSLEKTFAQTAITNAANLIGAVVEKGVSDDGETYQYVVASVEKQNDELVVNAKMITDIDDEGNVTLSDETTEILYTQITKVL
jgi:flagellar basal-body rod modification protein FlgD